MQLSPYLAKKKKNPLFETRVAMVSESGLVHSLAVKVPTFFKLLSAV